MISLKNVFCCRQKYFPSKNQLRKKGSNTKEGIVIDIRDKMIDYPYLLCVYRNGVRITRTRHWVLNLGEDAVVNFSQKVERKTV